LLRHAFERLTQAALASVVGNDAGEVEHADSVAEVALGTLCAKALEGSAVAFARAVGELCALEARMVVTVAVVGVRNE
jgi:ABC-type sulfate transport system permease component